MSVARFICRAGILLLIASAPSKRVYGATELQQQPSDLVRGFPIPARLMDGDSVGTLVLGETTLKEALEILPATPGHGPSKPDGSLLRAALKSAPDNVRDVLKRVKRAYNPLGTWLILQFDNHDKLVLVDSSNDYDRRPVDEITSVYPGLQEISRAKDEHRGITLVRLQANVRRCVLMEVFYNLDAQPDSVDSVGYLFTCNTERRRP